MHSPFPGMDPYLEHPEIFADLHDSLITYLRETLQPQLPEPYYAATGRRVWIEIGHRYVGPDVNVFSRAKAGREQSQTVTRAAVADSPSPRRMLIRVPYDEHREPLIEIYHGRGQDKRLVTTVEVISPANKAPGEHDRELYVQKQEELLAASVNLIEVDLIRGGEHTTAVPLDLATDAAGRFDYHASIHRFHRPGEYLFYPVRMHERLPEIEIPLLPEDPELSVDLQALFDRCYDTGPYSREIDYSEDPPAPRLSTEELDWVREQIAMWPARKI